MCEGTSEGTRFARLESPGAFVFTVPDRPIPKLRERRGGGGGKTPRTPEKVRDFELKVVWAAAEAGAIGEEPIFGSSEEGVDVWLFIHFGLGDDRRIGDLSNYQKAIEDGLNGKRIEFTQATDIGGERFEYGDTAHLGRVWRDDRRVSGAFTYRTFGGGEGVNVGVCKAGAVDTLAAFMDAVIDDFSDPEAVAL